MHRNEIDFLANTVRAHVRFFFSASVSEYFDSIQLRWCQMEDAVNPEGRAIYIPVDAAADSVPKGIWRVPFGDSQLTLWNPIVPPSSEWTLLNPISPLWYVHPCGAYMPAWNFAKTLFDLLTLSEERIVSVRDGHGRFAGHMSPRFSQGVLECPIFNDSVAALAAACVGISRNGVPDVSLEPGMVRPPVLFLSHDLDQLRGNDFWTQGARLWRALVTTECMTHRFRNIWSAFVNAFLPRRYYFDNIIGMIEIERMLGFKSALYFLNGFIGRFGARSGSKMIEEVASCIPEGWQVGIHYNYDTHLNPSNFVTQRAELEQLLKRKVNCGRAHYLRFDTFRSWSFYEELGIEADETLGYSDSIGYRAGIAAPFKPFNLVKRQACDLIEMPLIFMDTTFIEQYPDNALQIFEQHLRHISVVGGALSLLFHPGQFNNPEHGQLRGLYFRLLSIARGLGAESRSVAELCPERAR